MSTRRPQTRQEAIIWNRLNNNDMFYPIHTWPNRMIDAMLHKHKTNILRLNLLVFLIGNGLPPQIAVQWITRDSVYDAAATNQIRTILRDIDTYLQRYTYWDMYLQQYVNN